MTNRIQEDSDRPDDPLASGWHALWRLDPPERDAVLESVVELRKAKERQEPSSAQAKVVEALVAAHGSSAANALGVLDHFVHRCAETAASPEEAIEELGSERLLPADDEEGAREFLARLLSRVLERG